MSSPKSLGLSGFHSIEFFVKDLPRALAWHNQKFGFTEVARTTADFESRHGQKSVVMRGAGDVGWIFTAPIDKASSAGKWLARHPEGVSHLNFKVNKMSAAAQFLAERKASFLYDIQEVKKNNGNWLETSIATPLGETNFRFIESNNFESFAPGFEWTADWNKAGNPFAFTDIDHVTCNTRCMIGLTEFYRAVLGFEQYWGIEFHTAHHHPTAGTGSGLESIVMWDPESQIKFATNQPLQPYYNNSQIEIFIEDNNAAGIQHFALSVKEIIPVISGLREKGCIFLQAPGKYYKQLPERMVSNNIGKINEPMEKIEKLGILVDGRDNKYLLQLFMKEMCVQMDDPAAGPFFYEIIQRAGDPGFGDGNFKALFDSIEQDQMAASRQEMRDRVDSLI